MLIQLIFTFSRPSFNTYAADTKRSFEEVYSTGVNNGVEISLNVNDFLFFNDQAEGYSPVSPCTVVVTNTGSRSTGELNIKFINFFSYDYFGIFFESSTDTLNNGARATGRYFTEPENKWSIFDNNGVWLGYDDNYFTGWKGDYETGWYYYEEGYIKTGWYWDENYLNWYYLDPDSEGRMATGIFFTVPENIFSIFDESGAWRGYYTLREGWTLTEAGWYFYMGNYVKTGWHWDDYYNNWYYLDPERDGLMATGIIEIFNETHEFHESGYWIREIKTTPQYTDNEVKTIERARAMYKQSVDIWNKADKMFRIQPNASQTPLIAGELDENIAEATMIFLNIIRIGGGLPELKLNKNIMEAAQHKAALVVYAYGIGLGGGHHPAKPQGVSDEFYNKAMSYMTENLYMAGLFSGTPLSSIMHALNDGYDNPGAGHRYNLLNPFTTDFGIGLVGTQGVHKFSGYASNDLEIVAWPSNGVMFEETDYGGFWSARFYKNYNVTQNTTVRVVLLNTSETWLFNTNDINNDNHFYQIVGVNQVSFYDKGLNDSKKIGNIYEINVGGLTGKSDTYSYRMVYEQAYP